MTITVTIHADSDRNRPKIPMEIVIDEKSFASLPQTAGR
jgi:hypothetical protein